MVVSGALLGSSDPKTLVIHGSGLSLRLKNPECLIIGEF